MDAFPGYLRSLPNLPLLCKEEEKDLIAKSRSTNVKVSDAATEKLILSNLRLVISLARKYVRNGAALDDLISEGSIGLRIAIDKYEPDMGARLSTYAVWWIKQQLRKATNESRTIRIPIYQQKQIRKIQEVIARLTEITGQMPSDDEVSEEVGLRAHMVQTLRNLTVPMLSLQNPLGNEGGRLTYEDILSDQSVNGETPLEQLTKKNSRESLLGLISKRLNKREQKVIALRFGLISEDANCKTLEEVGACLNLARERIRQIQEQALQKLRRSLEAQNAHQTTLSTIENSSSSSAFAPAVFGSLL